MVKTLKNALRKKRAKFAIPHTPPPTRLLLQSSDFTPLGYFDLPHYADAPGTVHSTAFSISGLTGRYLSGTLHLLARSGNGGGSNQVLFEMTVPALVTVGDGNLATVTTLWGQDYSQSWVWAGNPLNWVTPTVGGGGAAGYFFQGLTWDESSGRLYASYVAGYSSGAAGDDPSLQFATLDNPAGPTMTAYGPWRFTRPKASGGGVVIVPTWFANAYFEGKNFISGFGGYYSILATGGGAEGPTAFVFSPPTAVAYNPTSPGSNTDPNDPFSPTLTNTALISYGASGTDNGPRENTFINRVPSLLFSGSPSAVGANTLTLPYVGGTTTDDRLWHVFQGCRVEVTAGTGSGQARTITNVNASTNVATVDSNWSPNPDTGSTVKVYRAGGRGNVSVGTSGTITSLFANGYFSCITYIAIQGENAGQQTGYFTGFTCRIVEGTGVGQSKVITGSSYDSGTGTLSLTFGSSWSPALDTTSLFSIDGPRYKGTVQSAASGTVTLDSFADPADGNLGDGKHYLLMLTGAAADEEHLIASYNGATKVATLGAGAVGLSGALNNTTGGGTASAGSSWVNTPANGDEYLIRPIGVATYTAYPNFSTGRAYQTYNDTYFGAGCWIDNGVKHGFLLWPVFTTGQVAYINSGILSEGYRQVMQMINPMDLAAVYAGSKAANTVDSAWEYLYQFTGITYDGNGVVSMQNGGPPTGGPPTFSGVPQLLVGGMWFDTSTNRLYVLVTGVRSYGSEYSPRIYVFQVG